MKRAVFACLALLTGTASAQPLFENRSESLPEHIYNGGWEHFVGGGLAVFDCDGDELPDIFAAGGANPAQLMRNKGDFVFERADIGCAPNAHRSDPCRENRHAHMRAGEAPCRGGLSAQAGAAPIGFAAHREDCPESEPSR